MTGIVGGTVDQTQLRGMLGALDREPWYESEQFEAGEYGLGLEHHGEKDPLGYTFWHDGRTAGVIDGPVTNLDTLGWDTAELFERLRRSPEATLAAVDGPFTIACVDADDDRILLATDKIGCRTPFYTTDGGFAFASGLGPLLSVIDDPSVDTQGVSDLLLMGNMWSDTTLLAGAKSVHPATVIEYCDGEVSERRYWKPDYTPAEPTPAYRYELTQAFQRTVERTASTMEGDVGLWLSGGLDSRATANELARADADGAFESLWTYTYDANPGGGINPRLADETADALGVPNETVPLTVDEFLPVIERAVSVSDGMVKWNTLLNLTAVFNVDREPDVFLEGHEGALVGHHLCRHHVTGASSLVGSMYDSEAVLSAEAVEDILAVPVYPLGSFRKEARRIDEPTVGESVVDAHFQNYYARLAHASNPVPRSQTGTRVPYADGEFLAHVARLPVSWRMGALPFSDGDLIFGVVEPKIKLIRALNDDLAAIPYERSRLKPSRPYPLHVAGFYAATALSQLLSKPTYGGGPGTVSAWLQRSDDFRETLAALLDSVGERAFLDAEAVATYRAQLDSPREADTNAISALTTLEIWLQEHLD